MSDNPDCHLSEAAEGVRSFNHTSRAAAKDWELPSHSYSALGSLSRLTEMLAQAVEQSTVPVTRTYARDRVLIDGNGDPDTKVAELMDAREEAMQAAAALAAAVQRMHNATSPMGLDTEGMPEFQDDEPHRD